MIPPDWLPATVRAEGWVPDLRTALAEALRHESRQAGTVVLFDADHTEATYAAAEALHARFDRVVIVTPRDTIATDVHGNPSRHPTQTSRTASRDRHALRTVLGRYLL